MTGGAGLTVCGNAIASKLPSKHGEIGGDMSYLYTSNLEKYFTPRMQFLVARAMPPHVYSMFYTAGIINNGK